MIHLRFRWCLYSLVVCMSLLQQAQSVEGLRGVQTVELQFPPPKKKVASSNTATATPAASSTGNSADTVYISDTSSAPSDERYSFEAVGLEKERDLGFGFQTQGTMGMNMKVSALIPAYQICSNDDGSGAIGAADDDNCSFVPYSQRYVLVLKVLASDRWTVLKDSEEITPQGSCFFPSVLQRTFSLEEVSEADSELIETPAGAFSSRGTASTADNSAAFNPSHSFRVSYSFSIDPVFSLPSDGRFVPILMLCDTKSALGSYGTVPPVLPLSIPFTPSITVSFDFVNPGGVGIGLQDIPLLSVFTAFSFIYLALALLSGVWLIWQGLWRKRKVTRIHALHLVAIILKLVNAAMSLIETAILRQANVDPTSQPVTIVKQVCLIIADVFFLGVQLALCRGLSYIYLSLSRRDRQILVGTSAFYALTLVLVAFGGEAPNSNRQTAYEFGAVFARFIITLIAYFSLLFTVDKARKSMLTGESKTEVQNQEQEEEDTRRRDEMDRQRQLEAAAGSMGSPSSSSAATRTSTPIAKSDSLLHSYLRLDAFAMPYSLYVLVPLGVVAVEYTLLSWENQYIEALLEESASVYYFLIFMFFFRDRAIV